ncbi:MAG: serine/threonine-protein kinase [Pirellulaceae bacterium]|nr:serine/threonine-protein kinase [Pirellulaceae bacterium]
MSNIDEILGCHILAKLGEGAKSKIYAVKDKHNQVYALKHVVKGKPKDQRFIEQATLEHKVASALNHPCLRRSYRLTRVRRMMRVTEVFVLMEMVDGVTLEQYQPPDLIGLCQVCGQIADGLAAMHEEGYIHADMKPNNVLVAGDAQVKIIDFGQSCRAGTVKKRIQGTPDYIAPEQVRRKALTPRTDVFNFGATMYWLLTGNHVTTMIPKGIQGLEPKDSESTPPPKDLRPEVPAALSALVMNCIEPMLKLRPESMSRVRDRLDLAIAQLQRRKASPPAAAS